MTFRIAEFFTWSIIWYSKIHGVSETACILPQIKGKGAFTLLSFLERDRLDHCTSCQYNYTPTVGLSWHNMKHLL
jgi:hypothetical protein